MMRALAMAAAAALAACEGPVTEIVAPLAVLNWYPSGNATCVPRETGVWVTFSQPVVEETLTDASIGLFQGITPVLAARGYDPDTWTVEIFPDPPLEFGTVYEVRLQPEITAEAGGSFHTVVASSFSTLPQTGCASAFACHVDAQCSPQLCSVTGACVDECAVPEDCPPGQVCVTDSCQ
jgi:hypothetical protein